MDETKDQKAIREYHEGAFQTIDPVTGEKRKEALPADTFEPITQELPNAPAARIDADYDVSWNKDELQAEVDRRGLTVKGTGEGGRVLKEDLIKAIRKDDKAK